MRNNIYKYFIYPYGDNIVELAGLVKILTVQGQSDNLALWVEQDPNSKEVTRVVFHVCPTGPEAKAADDSVYLASVQQHSLVFHVYYTIHQS